jgi:chloramphenicol 3-O phosphotransferase
MKSYNIVRVIMSKGIILLINGPSIAGKTTLSWELQTNAPGYWYWLPLDCFLDAVPSQQWDKDRDEAFKTAFDLYYNCIKLISDQGKDIIVDTVMCSKDAFASFENKLLGYSVIMVKVTCPVDELNRRELARGDRDIGLAAGQVEIMVPQQCYDLVLDTHAQSTQDCARQIIELLKNPQKPISLV